MSCNGFNEPVETVWRTNILFFSLNENQLRNEGMEAGHCRFNRIVKYLIVSKVTPMITSISIFLVYPEFSYAD